MRFTFQKTLRKRYVLDIGYVTPFHQSLYFITVLKEDLDRQGNVVWAELLISWFRTKNLLQFKSQNDYEKAHN